MKEVLTVLILLGTFGAWAQAQTGKTKQPKSVEEYDPKAKAILDKVQKKYDGYKSLDAAFSLEIELPEQAKQVQKGKMSRQGAKYFVDLNGQQTMLCDGKALWVILHQNKEVQINDAPDPKENDGSVLTPESLFNFYKNGKFVYALSNDYVDKGRSLQQIEFKPLDRGSEYSKIRLTIDKKTSEIVSAKAFGKDGTRYTFTITKLTPNKGFAANYFTFDKTKYPGYHIEDLRD